MYYTVGVGDPDTVVFVGRIRIRSFLKGRIVSEPGATPLELVRKDDATPPPGLKINLR